MFILTLFISHNTNGLIPGRAVVDTLVVEESLLSFLFYFVEKVEFYFCDSNI